MNATLAGRQLLTLVLSGTIIAAVGFQWNATHVFNQDWHSHGRFHAVQLIGFIAAMSILGLWLVWRNLPEPQVGTLIAATIPVTFWSGELYAALVPPPTSPST